MSLRVSASSLITGALVCGNRGLGVLGSAVPGSGDAGPGYLYNDLSLPADASKEVCGRITTWPSAGSLYAYEDSSFDFSGAPDGNYTFQYQLYVDGAATGSPATVTMYIGHGAAMAATSAPDTFYGSCSVAPVAGLSVTAAADIYSGSAESGAAVVSFTATNADDAFAGTAYSQIADSDKIDYIYQTLLSWQTSPPWPSTQDIAYEMLNKAEARPIHCQVKIINETVLAGAGTSADPMRPA